MALQETSPVSTPGESLREKCGIVGLYLTSANRASQISTAIKAEIGVWHRGQQGAGLTIKDANSIISHHGNGEPEQAFSLSAVKKLNKGKTEIELLLKFG